MWLLHRGVHHLFLTMLAILALPPAWAVEPPARQITLEEAVKEALARSPSLRARRASVDEATGRLLTARTYPFNPEVAVEAARRSDTGDSVTDRSVTITQEIEIAGQRRRRVVESSADLESACAQLQREERLFTADVRASFTLALQAREMLEVERSNTELARSLADVARKRFDAGAVPQMEVNLALAQVGRAERELHLAEGAYRVARTILAESVALDPSLPPEPSGTLELPARDPAIAARLASALAHREDLQAFRSAATAAQARIARVRREAVPNLVVWGSYGREEGTDRIAGGGVGFAIPVFNRNQGPVAEARAAQRRTAAEAEALELRVSQEVTSTLARYEAASEAAASLQRQVLGTLPENLELLQRSFEAGKIGWTEVLVFRREFVDVQRDYVATLTDAQLAAIELELAAGPMPSRKAAEEPQP